MDFNLNFGNSARQKHFLFQPVQVQAQSGTGTSVARRVEVWKLKSFELRLETWLPNFGKLSSRQEKKNQILTRKNSTGAF